MKLFESQALNQLYAALPGAVQEKLEIYDWCLNKWNDRINLVAKSTLPVAWSRHLLDSAQIWPHVPQDAEILVDFGSGAGFPGMVLAILAQEVRPTLSVTLVESDVRKCAFLSTVSRETSVRVKVLPERAEALKPQSADVVTARALAPLNQLLDFQERHAKPGGLGLYLKGANHDAELAESLANWRFTHQKEASLTHPDGVILKVGELRRE